MKSLFSGFLGSKASSSTDNQSSQVTSLEVEGTDITPLTLDSVHEHQRASLIGWVANKLATLMGLEPSEKVTYLRLAVTKDLESFNASSTEEEYILYLAKSLVTWLENGEDVYFNIGKLNIGSDYHKNLLIVHELIKDDSSLYFNRKAPDTKDIQESDKEWSIYRDVLHAASQMKFLLISEDELGSYMTGRVLCDEPVVEKSDIPRVRNIAKLVLEQEGLSKTTVSSYTLLISEAITNILKHAKDGSLRIYCSDGWISIIISDKGAGFPLKTLPYTVLTAGYSTKKSFGQGFTLMLKLATRVLLKTSSTGSTIVLFFEDVEGDNIAKAN